MFSLNADHPNLILEALLRHTQKRLAGKTPSTADGVLLLRELLASAGASSGGPCSLCEGDGCLKCGVAPGHVRAATIRRVTAAIHNACCAPDLSKQGVVYRPEVAVLGREMWIRLHIDDVGVSGYSWICLPSLDARGRSPVDWAARQAVDACLQDLERHLLITLGGTFSRNTVTYGPRHIGREPEVYVARRNGGAGAGSR
jgi:hypothetical protein